MKVIKGNCSDERNDMIKAIFMDYTGTMVKEDEPYTRELLGYFLSHSHIHSPQEALRVVWGKIKELEEECYGETFLKKDEMVDRIFEWCGTYHGLSGDFDYMHDIWRKTWIHAPLYEDVKPFFETCELPIYVVTNDDLCYIEESLKEKGIQPEGIVAAELVRACKPHLEIFEKALEIAGVSPGEVIHIGDSISSHIVPAKAVGITPIYLARNGAAPDGSIRTIRSLDELSGLFQS